MSTTDIAKAQVSTTIEENVNELPSGGEISATELSMSLRQLLEEPTHEIDNLVGACERLRKRLRLGADCIERDILEYVELSRNVTRVTGIIHEAVEKILSAPDSQTATTRGTDSSRAQV